MGHTDKSFSFLFFHLFFLSFFSSQCPTLDLSFMDETWSFLSYFCQKSMTFCRHRSPICLLLFRFQKNMTPLASWGFLGVHAHLHIDLKKLPVLSDCGMCGFVVYSYIRRKTESQAKWARRSLPAQDTVCRKSYTITICL